MKVRCWWHIIIGVGLPWLPWPYMLSGVALYIAYQYLQHRYLSKRELKDDSFKDILELGIAFGISLVIQQIVLVYINLAALIPLGLESVI